MARIDHDKKVEVEPKAAVVAEEQARAQAAADAAKAIKDECEADLAEVCDGWWSAEGSGFWDAKLRKLEPITQHMQAMPILNEALAALDTIKEADISYIKKLVRAAMQVLCWVRGQLNSFT